MRSVSTKSSKELKEEIKKAIKARKIIRAKENELIEETWKIKSGKCQLTWFLTAAREELGVRKAKVCKAFKEQVIQDWGGLHLGRYSCMARDLASNTFMSKGDLYRKHCCTCKWKPNQVQTRMVILRIKNGRGRRKQ